MVRLNAGSGGSPLPRPWINLDAWDVPWHRPDVLARVEAMPFADAAFEAVYAGHLIEHLGPETTRLALLEMFRVCLGPVLAVWPNIDGMAHAHARGEISAEYLAQGMIGGRLWPGDEHVWLPDPEHVLALTARPGVVTRPTLVAEWWPVNQREDDQQFAVLWP